LPENTQKAPHSTRTTTNNNIIASNTTTATAPSSKKKMNTPINFADGKKASPSLPQYFYTIHYDSTL